MFNAMKSDLQIDEETFLLASVYNSYYKNRNYGRPLFRSSNTRSTKYWKWFHQLAKEYHTDEYWNASLFIYYVFVQYADIVLQKIIYPMQLIHRYKAYTEYVKRVYIDIESFKVEIEEIEASIRYLQKFASMEEMLEQEGYKIARKLVPYKICYFSKTFWQWLHATNTPHFFTVAEIQSKRTVLLANEKMQKYIQKYLCDDFMP